MDRLYGCNTKLCKKVFLFCCEKRWNIELLLNIKYFHAAANELRWTRLIYECNYHKYKVVTKNFPPNIKWNQNMCHKKYHFIIMHNILICLIQFRNRKSANVNLSKGSNVCVVIEWWMWLQCKRRVFILQCSN